MRPIHFIIKYTLHGAERQFYLRAEAMNDSFAWHMAAIDAGLAPIPKYRIDRSPPVTKSSAMKLGIDAVIWSTA